MIGLPDEDFGEKVHTIVQPRPGVTLDLDGLDAFVRERVASYKRPTSYEVVDEPLRDDAGKLRRSKLKEERVGATKSAPGQA